MNTHTTLNRPTKYTLGALPSDPCCTRRPSTMGVWEQSPQLGQGAEPLVRVMGAKPPEAESCSTLKHPQETLKFAHSRQCLFSWLDGISITRKYWTGTAFRWQICKPEHPFTPLSSPCEQYLSLDQQSRPYTPVIGWSSQCHHHRTIHVCSLTT